MAEVQETLGATVLQPTTLLGRLWEPGEKLSAGEAQRVPPKNFAALVNLGVLTPGDGAVHDPSPEVKAAQKKVTTTRRAVAKAETALADVRAKLEAVEGEVEVLEAKRKPHALKAAQGNTTAKKALSELDSKFYSADRARRDLTLAVEEATSLLQEAKDNERTADQECRRARCMELADIRLQMAKEAERHVEALAELLRKLDQNADTVVALSGPSNQLMSKWRVRELFALHLGKWLDMVANPPARDRIGFAELEQQLIENQLKLHGVKSDA